MPSNTTPVLGFILSMINPSDDSNGVYQRSRRLSHSRNTSLPVKMKLLAPNKLFLCLACLLHYPINHDLKIQAKNLRENFFVFIYKIMMFLFCLCLSNLIYVHLWSKTLNSFLIFNCDFRVLNVKMTWSKGLWHL